MSASAAPPAPTVGAIVGTAVRAVVLLAAGAVVTFTPDHSPRIGFGVLALVAGGTGIVAIATSLRGATLAGVRPELGRGVVGAIAALVAVALTGATADALALAVAAWAILTGLADLVPALRSSTLPAARRDLVAVGAATVLLGVVEAAVPRDAVLVTGLLGAWAVVAGVLLALGAVAVRDARASASGSDVARASEDGTAHAHLEEGTG